MSIVIEKEYKSPIASQQVEIHETDLIQELGRRLGSLYGCDRNIVSADGRPDVLEFWQHAKSQEQMKIDQLKQVINRHEHGHGV
jgi:hypothetical protein